MDGGLGHSRDPRLASPGGSLGISIKTEGTWDAAPVAGQGQGPDESPAAAAASPSTDEEPPLCSLCHLGDDEEAMLGPLLEFDWSTPKRRATALVHQLCAAWAPRAHASDAVSGVRVGVALAILARQAALPLLPFLRKLQHSHACPLFPAAAAAAGGAARHADGAGGSAAGTQAALQALQKIRRRDGLRSGHVPADLSPTLRHAPGGCGSRAVCCCTRRCNRCC
jgi:hypothetical protein